MTVQVLYHDNHDLDYRDIAHPGRVIFSCTVPNNIIEADKLFAIAHPEIDVDKSPWIGRDVRF
jgi:hypothetical protein